jgi:cytochrome c
MDTVTVHKSLAVVLGVGPLLLVSVAYTEPFYTSSLLIAPFWLSVLWLVTLAFGLLYAYKYGFGGWGDARPRWHAASGLAGAAVLLCVPLIYLTNTQLMLDASAMARRPGFFDALLHVGNVLPRYLHFLLASLAIAGLWVMGWWGRAASGTPVEELARLRIFGGRVAIGTTAAQFVVGPLVLLTLPRGALTWPAVTVLALGVLAGLGAIFSLLDTLRGAARLRTAVALLAVTIACMGTTRHLIREALLQRPLDASAPAPEPVRMTPQR